MNDELNSLNENPIKKKGINVDWKKVLIATLIVVVIGVILFFTVGKKAQNNKEVTLIDSLNKEFKEIAKKVTEINNNSLVKELAKNENTTSLKIKLNTTNKKLSIINDYTLDLNIGFDKINKKNGINGIITKGNDKLDLLLFENNKHSYLYLNGLYNKYIDLGDINESVDTNIDINKTNIFKSINENDLDYLIDIIINSLNKNIKTTDLTSEVVNENVYNKQLSLTKITYTMTKDNYKNIVNDIKNALLNDEKALDILAKLSDTNINDIKENINSIETSDIENDITFNTYVNKDGIVKITADNTLNIINYNDELLISVSENNSEVIKLECSNNNVKFNINVNEVKANGNIKINENKDNSGKIEFTININNNNDKFDLKGDIDYKVSNKLIFNIPTNVTNKIDVNKVFSDAEFMNGISKNNIISSILESSMN